MIVLGSIKSKVKAYSIVKVINKSTLFTFTIQHRPFFLFPNCKYGKISETELLLRRRSSIFVEIIKLIEPILLSKRWLFKVFIIDIEERKSKGGTMGQFNKANPIEAGNGFINKYYPNCQGALLAGSVVRGEATETSDLDIVIFDEKVSSSYRESLIDFGWAIEAFVHNLTSYKQIFISDYERARPSMPRMVSEGIILKDNGIIDSIKKEAKKILEKGPEEWSINVINIKRYFITDVLYDFKGCSNRAEEIFIANTLADLVSEFVLRTNRQWVGASKWVVRSLRHFNEEFANYFVEVFDAFYKTGEKKQIIQLVENVLQPFGGELFNGFSLGKL